MAKNAQKSTLKVTKKKEEQEDGQSYSNATKSTENAALLEHERVISENSTAQPTLSVCATGLPLLPAVCAVLQPLAAKETPCILLGATEEEAAWLSTQLGSRFADVSSCTAAQRGAAYARGGVFRASARVITTDMINGVLDTAAISAAVVLHAETITEDHPISFTLYVFKERNAVGLVQAFTAAPLRLQARGLPDVAYFLRLCSVRLYPRGNAAVCAALTDAQALRANIRQPSIMAEIAAMLTDTAQSLCSAGQARATVVSTDAMATSADIRAAQKYADTADATHRLLVGHSEQGMFLSLLHLLHCADAEIFYYTLAQCVRTAQESAERWNRRNSAATAWAFAPSTQTLLDRAHSYCQEVTGDARVAPSTPGMFEAVYKRQLQRLRGTKQAKDKQVAARNDKEEEDPAISEPVAERDASEAAVCAAMEEAIARRTSQNIPRNPKIAKILKLCESLPGGATVLLIAPSRLVATAVSAAFEGDGFPLSARLSFVVTAPGEGVLSAVSCFPQVTAIFVLTPCLAAIRTAEYVSAVAPAQPIVYLLVFKDSVEEQLYLSELTGERSAFEKLATTAAGLPARPTLEVLDVEEDPAVSYEVVVDAREMRASLPFALYRAGNALTIRTLQTGDYRVGRWNIERKSVEDLRVSLDSGRLYEQAMRLIYEPEIPVLLIEFPEGPPTLMRYEYREEFGSTLIAKLCVFLHRFRSFRVLWADSPLQAVRLIRDLQNQDAPQLLEPNRVDPQLYELLLRVTGITPQLAHRAMEAFSDLKELAFAELPRLQQVFDRATAQKVFDFFRTPIDPDSLQDI